MTNSDTPPPQQAVSGLGPDVFDSVTDDGVRPVSQPLKFSYAYDSSTTRSPVLDITVIVSPLLFQTGADAFQYSALMYPFYCRYTA